MTLKKLALAAVLCCSAVAAWSQSMTDDQVLKYALEQQQKGASQQKIATDLLKRGVTMQQLQRVRRKYTAEREQLGAVDLTGRTDGQTDSRLRQRRQQDGEQRQMRDNYMVRSQLRGKDGTGGYTREEREAQLNGGLDFLDIDSLLYYRNLLSDQNAVFGRNIFDGGSLTFEPNANMATPANYVLGAGDNVVVDVWGASQESFSGVVSPDGVVVVEGVGPIRLAGLTVREAEERVRSVLGRYYSDSQVSLSMGENRSVQVQVMGEVKRPGTYTLSSLSSAFNALYAAGGISDIGTLRDIKVFRGGRQVASIDVYDYILNGNVAGDVRLQDNDIVVVGTYDCLVCVRGKVKRPMFYEMKKRESLATLVGYAGGFAGDAYRKSVRVVRKSGNEYSVHTVGEFDMNGFTVDDGDSLYVDSVIPRYSNMVEIRGAVFHGGMFELGGAVGTVRELVGAADGLREDAFVARAVMHRQKDDLTLEVLSVDLGGILNGSSPDIALRKNDVLFVPSRTDMLGERTLTVSGEVHYPGVYQFAENSTVEDLILQAGGLTDAASLAKVDVFRRRHNAAATEESDTIAETFSFAVKDGFVVDGQPGFALQPYDEVVVRRSPTYMELQTVTADGAVNFTGRYTVTSREYKLTDLVRDAGGLSRFAYAHGARLERMMTAEEKLQREASLRAQQISLYEESMNTANKEFDLTRADSLLTMKLDLGNTFAVAIDLDAAMRQPGGPEDIVLRDGDRLVVPQYSNTVKVSGDVNYPTSMNFRKGETLDYYIKRAGGYGDNARRNRVYAIYMNGSVKQLSHHSRKAVQPGCEIVVPSKKARNKMTTAETMSIGTSAASIATMIITVANILK